MPKIQVKRGNKASIPTLSVGEFGLATDTNELYIGGTSGNIGIGKAPVVYGVRISRNDPNPAAVVYTDDAVGMTGGSSLWWSKFPFNKIKPVMFKNGAEVYDLKKTDTTKKADGTPADITSGNDGDAMVYFPQIWISITSDSSYIYVKISKSQVDDTYECYQDMRGGVHKGQHYIGCYQGFYIHTSEYTLRSLSGKTPKVNILIGEARSAARANSSSPGYEVNTFYNEVMLQALYLIFYKNRDSQTALGKGQASSGVTNTGETNTLGNGGNYGDTSGTVKMKFLWVEDWYGTNWEFIDGIIIEDYKYCTTNNPNIFNESGTNYDKYQSTYTYSGYISEVTGTNETGFLPIKSSGSETTYYCDHVYLNPNCPSVVFGGSFGTSVTTGAFSFLGKGVSSSQFGSNIGARLCYI